MIPTPSWLVNVEDKGPAKCQAVTGVFDGVFAWTVD